MLCAGTMRETFRLQYSILGRYITIGPQIPDEVVERLLTLLRDEEMYKSPYAGHVLNFFEFESAYLNDREKWLCIGFLNAHGDEFHDVFAHQVVVELRYSRYGDHLKMKRPNPRQWKDYQTMQNDSE